MNDPDINKVHEEAEKFQHKQHEAAVHTIASGGKDSYAKSIGIQGGAVDHAVTANAENLSESEKTTRAIEKILRQQELQKWLNEYLDNLVNDIRKIQERISILEQLKRLHDEGKLDLNNLEHVKMLESGGITIDEYESSGGNVFAQKIKAGRISLEEKQENYETAKRYNAQISDNPSDDVLDKIVKWRQTKKGVVESDLITTRLSSKDDIRVLDKEAGFNVKEQQLLQEVSEDLSMDFEGDFSDKPISFADEVSKTPIQASVNLKQAFTEAADPNTVTQLAAPAVEQKKALIMGNNI